VERQGADTLRVTGAGAGAIGDVARTHAMTLLELSEQRTSLEQRYMELTAGAVDYRTAGETRLPGPVTE
jgi:ABC-2 type transport system ATP-binding protein